MDLRFAAQTDIGRHRTRNEDRAIVLAGFSLFGVADGVGGLPGGQKASALACETVEQALAETEHEGGGVASDPADRGRRLVRAVHRANEAVVACGRQVSPAVGIATTLTVGQFVGDRLLIAHVGDSRCYGWLQGRFAQLTTDHSEMHALTRCVGQRQPLTVDLIERGIAAGDRLLFCTDGLSGELAPSEIAALTRDAADPGEVLRKLVAIALARGGPDNITAVLVCVG